eukprot:1225717-Rhodomonas_salina.2
MEEGGGRGWRSGGDSGSRRGGALKERAPSSPQAAPALAQTDRTCVCERESVCCFRGRQGENGGAGGCRV